MAGSAVQERVREKALAFAEEGIDRLIAIGRTSNVNPVIAMNAIEKVLERGLGKPVQPAEVNIVNVFGGLDPSLRSIFVEAVELMAKGAKIGNSERTLAGSVIESRPTASAAIIEAAPQGERLAGEHEPERRGGARAGRSPGGS